MQTSLPSAVPGRSIDALDSGRAAILHLVFGPQGAGKSSYSAQLALRVHGVCLAIDPWMIELYGPDMSSPLDFAWVMQRVQRCEARIWKTAVAIARQGLSVVLDLGCMRVADRLRFAQWARQAELQLETHFVSADVHTRRQRVLSRNVERGETCSFVVSPAMFDMMERRYEAPDADELANARLHRT